MQGFPATGTIWEAAETQEGEGLENHGSQHQTGCHICLYCSNRWETSSHSKKKKKKKKLIYKSRDSVKLPGWNLKEKGIRMRAGTHLSISFLPLSD